MRFRRHDLSTWYVANTAYALPFAPFTAYLAILASTLRTGTLSYKRRAAAGIICFLTAGLAETFVIFQITLLSIFLILTWLNFSAATRRQLITILSIGWFASLASLFIQILSPGVAARNAFIAMDVVFQPFRQLPELVSRTIDVTFEYMASPELLTGFWLLVGIGLLISLSNGQGAGLFAQSQPLRLSRAALIWNIAFQLCCAPIIWTYTSDAPQFFGRFSIRYVPFVAVNMGAIFLCLVLLWQRKRISAFLSERGSAMWRACSALFLFVCALLAIEILAVRIFAWLYLLSTVLFLLSCVMRESLKCQSMASPACVEKILLAGFAITWICQASIVATMFYVRGTLFFRTMTPGPYLLLFTGLTFGFCLGYLAKPSLAMAKPQQQRGLAIKVLLYIGIAAIAGAMFLGQISLIPEIQSYAKQWDENHAKIITLRDSGQTPIEVDPLPKGFGAYMSVRDAECYYGVPVEVAGDS